MSNIKKFRIKSFKSKNIILKLNKLSFKFGRKIILDNLNLELSNGQILGLLGPNGAGKSTIFNLIIGLLSPNFGSILINEEKIMSTRIIDLHAVDTVVFYLTKVYSGRSGSSRSDQ